MAFQKVPTLDGAGRVHEKHLPDRLSPDSLDATITGRINEGSSAFPDGPLPTTSLTAGTVLIVGRVNGEWPERPTARTDIRVVWVGPDPDPDLFDSGTSGALNDIDFRWVT